MKTYTIDLSWLCLIIPIGILVVAAILGARSKLQYGHQIREAQARGAFADTNTPKNRSRLLRLIIFGWRTWNGFVHCNSCFANGN
jgi:hypothetical protein